MFDPFHQFRPVAAMYAAFSTAPPWVMFHSLCKCPLRRSEAHQSAGTPSGVIVTPTRQRPPEAPQGLYNGTAEIHHSKVSYCRPFQKSTRRIFPALALFGVIPTSHAKMEFAALLTAA